MQFKTIRHDGLRNLRRQPHAALALHRITPGQHADDGLRGQHPPECDPVFFRPQLAGGAGGMQQHCIGRRRQAIERLRRGNDAVLRRTCRHVAQRLRGETAVALHGMLPPRYCMCVVIKQAQRFARARPIKAVAHAARKAGDPCAFQQALRVDHGVVMLPAQFTDECAHLAPHRGIPQRPPPAPHRDRPHARHARMQLRDRGKRLFNDPVDGRAGHGGSDVAGHGQVMHHVAQRRGFDQQNARHRGWRGMSSRPGTARPLTHHFLQPVIYT